LYDATLEVIRPQDGHMPAGDDAAAAPHSGGLVCFRGLASIMTTTSTTIS